MFFRLYAGNTADVSLEVSVPLGQCYVCAREDVTSLSLVKLSALSLPGFRSKRAAVAIYCAACSLALLEIQLSRKLPTTIAWL